MNPDWLDDLLDRHPGEPVPEGFQDRLRARLREDSRPAPLLRPIFRQLIPAAAAAVVFLVLGFWLGRGGGEFVGGIVDEAPPSAELIQNLPLLEAWDLVADESLELGLSDAAAGTSTLDENGGSGEGGR